MTEITEYAEQVRAQQPRVWWTVIHAGHETDLDYSAPILYRSYEHAAAVAYAKSFDFPALRPFRVVKLIEVTADAAKAFAQGDTAEAGAVLGRAA